MIQLLLRPCLPVWLVLMASGLAHAGIVTTVPTDLSPGDQYRLVFITRGARDAQAPSIDDYNAFVTTQANYSNELAALGLAWKVIGSTYAVDARENTSTIPGTDGAGIPIYRLDGTRIADSYADLWDGSIDSPLNVDQYGNVYGHDWWSQASVWTGTDQYGYRMYGLGCYGAAARIGGSYYTDYNWIAWCNTYQDESHPFYAISSDLEIQDATVPEPGSLAVWIVMAMVANVGWKLRRKR